MKLMRRLALSLLVHVPVLKCLLSGNDSVAVGAEHSFSYDPNSALGPSNWGDIDYNNNQCAGDRNSPIALKSSHCSTNGDYKSTPGTCRASDLIYTISAFSVQAAFPNIINDSSCTVPILRIPENQTKYRAKQLHLHIVSEHTIDGRYFDGELHIVHASDDGRLAVVAVMLDARAANANHSEFETLLQGWTAVQEQSLTSCGIANSKPRRNLAPQERDYSWNVHDLIPFGTTFYSYDGSLTTPPCSEIVWWNVANVPLGISRNQYERFVDFIAKYRDPTSCALATVANPQDGSTHRPIQAQNGRPVHRICPTTFVEETSHVLPAMIVSMVIMGALYLMYKTRCSPRHDATYTSI